MKLRYKLLLSLFLIANTAFSQEVAKNRPYILDDFSGGLNTQISDHSTPKNQCVISENIRYNDELKSLSKRNLIYTYGSADSIEPITSIHRLYKYDGTKILIVTHGDEIETGNDDTGVFTNILNLTSSNYKWQWLTWHDIAIGTDGYNQPVKYDGSSASATYLGSCLALDAGSGAGPDGSYTYKVSFYTTSYEVCLGVASNTVTVTDNDINLSMIPIGPDTFGGEDVIGRKIYRTSDGGTDYKLLSNGTIADNTTVTLTDSDADGARGNALNPTYTYAVPKGRFSVVHKNRLWLANDPTNGPSRAYYSDDSNPDYFFPTDYYNVRINDGDQITFIKNLLGILTVGKENSIQKIYTTGDTPSTDWEVSDPFSFIGCRAPYSAINSVLGIIYLSNDGIYSFNGQNSTLISEAVTPEILDISPSNLTNCWAESYNNSYYLTYTSIKSGSSVNNRVLIFNILGNSYTTDLLSLDCFSVFNSGTDYNILYSGSSTNGNIYNFSSVQHELIHSKHSDFSGTFTDMRYIPTRWGGDEDSPVLEISRTASIDSLVGTIDTMSGTIDRERATGEYLSPYLTFNASSFDKAYWNHTLPSSGSSVGIALRSGATTSDCLTALWSSVFTNQTGSDISGVTADTIVQYKIMATSDSTSVTPTLYKANNYVIRLTYNTNGTLADTSVPLHWQSGWSDLGIPGYKKMLRKVYIYHEGTSGTLNVKFINELNRENNFSINLATYPEKYTGYFSTGGFLGEEFKIDITNNDNNDLIIKRIVIYYDVEPLV